MKLSNTSITTDFTISQLAHESTSMKHIKLKRNQFLEFETEKLMSNTATMLLKIIGNDLLVQTYGRTWKQLKSLHSPKNLHEYKYTEATLEVKLLIIDNLNKDLKSIEHQI